MTEHRVVSREAWLEARRELLAEEKAFTRQRDALARRRRELPWVRIDEPYRFEGPDGPQNLSDLFDGRSQLIVQHFMFGSDWEEGCPMCSFWADSYNGMDVHLAQRDITFVAVSTAPFETIDAYRRRMGWGFKWVSSAGSDFNRDFHVTFTPEEVERGEMFYNYGRTHFPSTEGPGTGVFYKDKDGTIFHTYSCYARGLDILNGAYHYIDIAPKGRDEEGLPFPMAWVRRHDQYVD